MAHEKYPLNFNNEIDETIQYPAIRDMIYKTRRRTQSFFPYHDPDAIRRLDRLLLTPSTSPNDVDKQEMLKEFQASILKHHKKQHVYYFFIRFKTEQKNVQPAKEWIANFTLNKVSTAYQELSVGDESIYGIYLTHQAYKFLEVRDEKIPGKESTLFNEGLLKRVNYKNKSKADIEETYWDKDKWHIVIMYASNSDIGNKNPIDLLNFDNKHGLEKVCDIKTIKIQKGGKIQKSEVAPFKDEWFGFKDGISQPYFFEEKRYLKDDKIFPLGLVAIPDNGGQNWYSCGSFVALMKIEQDEDAFNKAVDEITSTLGLQDKELAEAYLVGRYKNGTSITTDNKPSSVKKANFNDNFNYQERIGTSTDQYGGRCPFHAHTRRANPRTPDTEDKTLARRGIPYDDRKEGGKVGLMFMSFQHSLEDQFEVVLNDWMLNSFINDYPLGQDAIIGDDHSIPLLFPVEWNSERPSSRVQIKLKQPITKFKGGLYLFAPSLSFLLCLAPDAYEKWQLKNVKQQNNSDMKKPKFATSIENQTFGATEDSEVMEEIRLKPFVNGSSMRIKKIKKSEIKQAEIPIDESQEMQAKRKEKFIPGSEEKITLKFEPIA